MPSEDPTPKPERKSQKPKNPKLGRFDPFLGRSGFSHGSRFRPLLLYMRWTGGAPAPDDLDRKISWPAVTLGCWILSFSGHFRPTHTSLPPFLDPLNSFPWSFSPDSSLFERYDKKKFGRLLDLVFRPPQQPLDQGEGTDVFLVSWAFH